MYDNRPIGVFDSGVGGLSVLQEVKKFLPNERFIYLADQINIPYGAKSKSELEYLSERIIKFLIKQKVKAIIVACNTATVYALDHMRKNTNIPIIGTVPVVKTAVAKTKSRKAVVFSTPATAKSTYLSDLINKFGDGVKFYTVGGTGLEDLVETGNLSNPKINKVIRETLEPLVNKGADVVVLGCTHYPFLRKNISKIIGNKVMIIDSGGAIARRTKYILEHENLLSSGNGNDVYYTTGNSENFKNVAEKLLNKRLVDVHSITI